MTDASRRLQVGDLIQQTDLVTLRGDHVILPAADGRVAHLQFRRYAGCPVCSLHLRGIARRIAELSAANVREVAVFHSEAETLRPIQGELPFDVIADPTRSLYRRFGVESSIRSVLDPRAWGAMMGGMFATGPLTAMKGEGGHLGLPADFLIAPSGKIVACKYGAHANDQWTVDEILSLIERV